MERDNSVSRRRVLSAAGAGVTLALLAGCTEGGGPGENNTTGGDNETTGGGDENETGAGGTDNETEAGNETGDDNETAAGGSSEWEGVDEIVLDGVTEGWEGVEPAPIEGETNPTLILTEGQEYDITWENADGQPHNIVIWDDNDEVVEDYQTEIIEEEGETQTLTLQATSEMTQYVCEVHIGTMIGEIQVESGG
ncbi:plastocyanin/azurin family copper-binding protein [Saliphagus sp. GCM10025317]